MTREFNNDLIYSIIQADIDKTGYASISRVHEVLVDKGINVDVTIIKERIDIINEKNNPDSQKNNFNN